MKIVRRYIELKKEIAAQMKRYQTLKKLSSFAPDNTNKLLALIGDNISELCTLFLEMESKIEQVQNSLWREILRKRILDGKRWQEIERELYYAPSSLYRKYRQALKELEAEYE
jgi:hypothetical protein